MLRYVLIAASALLAGCANISTVYRETDGSTPRIIAVDANQRFLTVTQGRPRGALQVCAERSPDAIQAIAGALGVGATTPTYDAFVRAASAQAAGMLALRTQTTMVQAELLYRLCALYANGGLTDIELSTQLRRFQNTMLAALAIEQLTGVPQPSSFTLAAGAQAAVSPDAVRTQEAALAEARRAETEAEARFNEARQARDAAQRRLTEALSARDAVAVDAAEYRRLAGQVEARQAELANDQQEFARRERTLNEQRQARQAAERAVSAARGAVNVTAEATPGQATIPQRRTPDEQREVNRVAEEIGRIVRHVVDQSFVIETCLQIIATPRQGQFPSPENDAFCRAQIAHHMQTWAAREREHYRHVERMASRVRTVAAVPPPVGGRTANVGEAFRRRADRTIEQAMRETNTIADRYASAEARDAVARAAERESDLVTLVRFRRAVAETQDDAVVRNAPGVQALGDRALLDLLSVRVETALRALLPPGSSLPPLPGRPEHPAAPVPGGAGGGGGGSRDSDVPAPGPRPQSNGGAEPQRE